MAKSWTKEMMTRVEVKVEDLKEGETVKVKRFPAYLVTFLRLTREGVVVEVPGKKTWEELEVGREEMVAVVRDEEQVDVERGIYYYFALV